MSDRSPAAITEPVSTPPAKRGHSIVAWLVICLTVGTVVWRTAAVAPKAHAQFDPFLIDLQIRGMVGVADLLGMRNEGLYHQTETAIGKGYYQQIYLAILAGELLGPVQARDQLRHLPDDRNDDPETVEALDTIFRMREEGELNHNSRRRSHDVEDKAEFETMTAAEERVRDKLGWSGALALNPPDTPNHAERERLLKSARRTAAMLLTLEGMAFILVPVGLGLLGIVLGLAAYRKVRPRLSTGSPNGGIYAETFALWMTLFLGLAFLGRFIPAGNSHLLVSIGLELVSLSVLAWPVIRGVAWRDMLREVGLARPARPGFEVLAGVSTYVVAVPFLAAGVVAMLILMAVAKRLGYEVAMPGHPLVKEVAESGAWGYLQALVAACIMAPIVEEMMFRGFLLRHLRELTARWGRVLSFIVSAFVVSFLFAVIHPQGWLGMPALMGLAFAFCLAREFRGTLIPCMVAHAIQNSAVLIMVYVMAG
jgi:hypothetical protein